MKKSTKSYLYIELFSVWSGWTSVWGGNTPVEYSQKSAAHFPKLDTLFMTLTAGAAQMPWIQLWRAFYWKWWWWKVTPSNKHTQFKTRPYPIKTKMAQSPSYLCPKRLQNLPFWAAHPHVSHFLLHPLPPEGVAMNLFGTIWTFLWFWREAENYEVSREPKLVIQWNALFLAF